MLAFLAPNDDKTQLYLLNDSTYRVHYLVGIHQRNGQLQPLAHGLIEPDSKQLIKTIDLSHLREAKTLRLQAILCKNVPYTPHDLQPADLQLNPLKIFKQGAFTQNEFFDQNALIYHLLASPTHDESHTPHSDQAQDNTPSQLENQALPPSHVAGRESQTPHSNAHLREIDLRAEALVSDPTKLQAAELLDLQLHRFNRALQDAISSGSKAKIVFIHGIGSGSLKQQLRNTLTRSYPNLQYRDASFKQYAYGAIMIFL